MAKEKLTKEIRMVVQPSLYDRFQAECEKELKTVSSVMRELMLEYVVKKNKLMMDDLMNGAR